MSKNIDLLDQFFGFGKSSYTYPFNFNYTYTLKEPDKEVSEKETEEEFIISAKLPGVSIDNVNVSVENEELLVIEAREIKENILHEYSYKYTLPNVDIGNVQTKYEDGLLTLKFQKIKHRTPKTVKINIKKQSEMV